MAYVGTAQTLPASLIERVRNALGFTAEKMIRRKIYRTTLTELRSLGNRDLADLGLARSELQRVAWEAAYGPDAEI